ncbi:MAG TPA: hypothetical protein VMZ24_01085 [Patescibacteria group bacterium]|jgi:hypothetical protein|nr:hypothetical protein [Patescibacteria group bacterium]
MGNIPTIYEFLEYLDFLRGFPAAYVVLITASLILIFRDWRWSILALLIQYLVVGLLLADVMPPHLAFMKVIIGIFICLILFITAQQVNWGRLPEDVTAEEAVLLGQERLLRFGPYMLPTDAPFRIFLGLAVALSVGALTQKAAFHLPFVDNHLNLAVFGLFAMGLVIMVLTSEPMKSGMGFLTLITGFELFYSTVEQPLAGMVIFAVISLSIALAIAYLTQVRHSFPALFD